MLLTEFISGAVFGTALLGAGVYAPDVIKAQMTFSSNVMITVMMGASASSAYVHITLPASPNRSTSDMLR